MHVCTCSYIYTCMHVCVLGVWVTGFLTRVWCVSAGCLGSHLQVIGLWFTTPDLHRDNSYSYVLCWGQRPTQGHSKTDHAMYILHTYQGFNLEPNMPGFCDRQNCRCRPGLLPGTHGLQVRLKCCLADKSEQT